VNLPILQLDYGELLSGRPESTLVNAIRVAASAFILVLIVLSAMGWVWTGSNQPPAQALAGRTVLVLGALAGLAGLIALWRWPGRT
jgi:hypothetical protein